MFHQHFPVKYRRWLGIALAITCGGCADVSEPHETSRDAVIGGKVSEATDDAVVLLRTDREDGPNVCSGALLAPNLVLTARHCIVLVPSKI